MHKQVRFCKFELRLKLDRCKKYLELVYILLARIDFVYPNFLFNKFNTTCPEKSFKVAYMPINHILGNAIISIYNNNKTNISIAKMM